MAEVSQAQCRQVVQAERWEWLNKTRDHGVKGGVLRSPRDLEKFKVTGVEGAHCGRIKDVYFDDASWKITHLVLSIEPRQFGNKQVLIHPDQIACIWNEEGIISLGLKAEEIEALPLASTVLPVCKQYAQLAFASPGARLFANGVVGSDPHLRSARAVTNYRINVAGEFGGTLESLVFDDESWEFRYLGVEQIIERKKMRFFVLPQSVERFTWATQRVVLRDLQPVRLESGTEPAAVLSAA
jgi:hypothetical protein